MKKKIFTLLALLLTVCSGAWAAATTIGRIVTFSAESAAFTYTNGTATDITVSTISGDCAGNGVSGNKEVFYKSNTKVAMAQALCYKSNNSSSYIASSFGGFSAVIPGGKKFTVNSINVEIAVGNNFGWRVEIVDGANNLLYQSSDYTVTNYENKTGRDQTNTDVDIVPSSTLILTGSVYFRLHYWYASTSKYMVPLTLTLTGEEGIDSTPSHSMTVTENNSDYGTASVSSASVREGSSATFTATANTGYKFVNWTNTSTGTAVSTDNPYTIASVSEAVSLTANFAPAYSISYNVTDGSKGTTTTGLGTEYTNDEDKFTAPQNYYIFKDGYTLTSWSDGENTYIPGTEYTLTKNITLQPVFTANTKTLDDRTTATTVTWNFNYIGDEAPAINIQNATGYYIQQATIDGVSTDIVMTIDNTKGSAIADVTGKTQNNYDKATQPDRTYAQVNRGSKWTIPAVKGMTIVAYSANGNFLAADDGDKYATRIDGAVATSGTGTRTATWTYTGEAATIDYVAGNDAGYISKLVVTYPSPYSVTYDGNGSESGSVTDASTYDKNASVTTQANSFVKTGYAFTGWNTEADGSGTAIAAGTTFTITGNTTLYAQWMEGEAETITYVVKTTTAASTTASTHLTNLVNETNVGIAAVTDQSKADRSGKYDTSSTEGNGVKFSFDIAEGYTFRPTSIAIQLATVSTTDFTFHVTLTDSQGQTLSSNALNTFAKDGELTNVTFPAYDKTLAAGTVTMLVTAVREDNATGTYRIGKTITISGVVNEGAMVGTKDGRNYATYVPACKLDFGSADGITAYIATGLNGDKDAVVLKEVSVVEVGTPIIVKTDTQGATVNVPVTTADASYVTGNALVAGDGTTAWNGTSGYTYYYIASDEFHKAIEGTLQSGKAYLKVDNSDVPAGAPALGFVFADSETTGVGASLVNNGVVNNEIYNLNGQRVAQPTKGLYIVNGKKVIVK